MQKKAIESNLHYLQYVIARVIFIGVIGFLIYSIWTQKIGAIIFCLLFIFYILILIKKVFNKPIKIEFDENFIYIENEKEKIELDKVLEIKKNKIFYLSNGVESKIRLPNFHFMDKNWVELKELIKRKKH